jgi:hypothetical protein
LLKAIILGSAASLFLAVGTLEAETEQVTLKNGITYEVKVDDGVPVGAESRQVKMDTLGAMPTHSTGSDAPEWVWHWQAKLRQKGTFAVTVTTPIDETLSTSFDKSGPGEISQEFFNSKQYPTLWTWLDEPGTTWIPFIFSFDDLDSDRTFEITQWLRFDDPEKNWFKRSAARGRSISGQLFKKTETVNPPFGDRDWELGNRFAEGNRVVLEYVLSGETVENWSELITVQSFVDATMTPRDLLSVLQQQTLKDCPNAMWNVIRQSDSDIVVEWRTEGCVGPADSDDQYEITRALSGPLALHTVSYVTKRQPHLPETERSEWIDRIGRAELIVQIGVVDYASRNYPVTPTRAILVEGGSIAVQAGVMGDPERPPRLFGKKMYPARYFVFLFNETDRTIWYQTHWYFPHKSKDKVKQKSAPVRKLEPGEKDSIWWAKNGIVADKDHPLKFVFSTDKKQKDILHTEETHMYFATPDVDAFKTSFDDFVSQGSGHLPMIFGWLEMPFPKTDIPGTVADADLQVDIQHSLRKEQSKKYRDCEHETLRAESVNVENNAVAISEIGERDRLTSKSQHVLREYWWVRSCDVTSKFEVLLAESSDGAAEIKVTKIGETNKQLMP